MTIVVVSVLGGEPATAEEYFSVLRGGSLAGALRLDLASLVNVSLYTVTSFAVYIALKRTAGTYAALATAIVFLGVAISLANHSALSLLNLSEQYARATSEAQRAQLLAIGEAVIATDWWHSTGGFMAGLFIQGGAVLYSFLMLRTRAFGRVTAYAGILANGLDWLHVIVGPFLPAVAIAVLAVGGLFYLAWFPMLGRDLIRLGRGK
jgi:hypothetical protein